MSQPIAVDATLPQKPWYHELNRYHWFVLAVCTLGWLFDCLDQQLFNIARPQAIPDLVGPGQSVETFTGLSTSMLLIGWATGGIIFGIMGDRIGRAKTMFWTILAYSIFTGLSAFSVGVYDFILYRFLTGLGVGGQFAVGVSLVAEVMPDRARPHALGMLQAFSAVGNVTAGLIGIGFSMLAAAEVVSTYWRGLFAIGILPALLSVVVISRLREPERWKEAVAEKGRKQAGSLTEMFTTPRWRSRALVGVVLASSGVIGLWAIGVYSNDLISSIFRKEYQQEARNAGSAAFDRRFVCTVIHRPELLDEASTKLQPRDLLAPEAGNRDPELLYAAALQLHQAKQTVTPEAVLAAADPTAAPGPDTAAASARRAEYLRGATDDKAAFEQTTSEIVSRQKQIKGKAGLWTSVNLLLFNVGAFFGIYLFSRVTQHLGRRPTFAIFFLAAMVSTSIAFLYLEDWTDIFWMTPIMGACQLSVFGGYAIYFPELFPTRMRATGTSVCYNIARYAAAFGPVALTQLSTRVFGHHAEPMRYAGVTMCAIFLLGIAVLPFAPETKDQPLPE
jgi:MFS family permease